MSYIDCIKKAKISAQKKKEAEDIFRERYDEYLQSGMAEKDADFAAGKDTADIIEVKAAAEKKRKVRTIQAQRKLSQSLEDYRNSKGEKDYAEAAISILERDQNSKNTSVNGRYNVIKGQIHSLMTDFLFQYQPTAAGLVRPKAGLSNVVRELFGESTGDLSASELGQAVSKGLEELRLRANRAGANIGKKENYGMPQTHDRVKIAKIPREQWVEFVSRKLDWEKMTDPNTGKSIPTMRRQAVLENVYDTIKTEGYSKLKPSESMRKGALDKRLANHRFLEFKDADSWLEYHEKFGVGSAFDVIISHVDKMSRDIAMMEILGPNPHTGKEFLKMSVLKNAADLDASDTGGIKKSQLEKAKNKLQTFDEMYAILSNTTHGPAESMLASSLGGFRNVLTSAFLGSASLLAIPSDAFMKNLTKGFNKLPVASDMARYLKLMNPASNADRKLAVRSGLIADAATSIAYGQQRFLGTISGPQWTRRLADVTMRTSLMTPHTQASKWAFGMEVMGLFADNSAKKFDELQFKPMLERYGITAEQWDIFRKTPAYKEKGAKFLRPDDLRVREDLDERQAQELSDKIMEMILEETEYAVPSASIRGRAFLVSDSKSGTFIGEIGRSFAMFKNFPVTIMFTHMRRGLSQEKLSSRLSYMAAFGIGLTTVGALGLQMRQIAAGKDPMNMNPTTEEGRNFWGQAALTGGGLGIWGDFLFSNLNRYGHGIEDTIAGPVFSEIASLTNLTVGNIAELAKGEETNFLSEAVANAKNIMPLRSVWYLRLVLEREVFDQLELMADPDAARKFKQKERKLKRENNQEYWWSPSDSLLRGDNIRAPDLEAAIED